VTHSFIFNNDNSLLSQLIPRPILLLHIPRKRRRKRSRLRNCVDSMWNIALNPRVSVCNAACAAESDGSNWLMAGDRRGVVEGDCVLCGDGGEEGDEDCQVYEELHYGCMWCGGGVLCGR